MPDISTHQYEGNTFRYIKLPDKDILFNTKDICKICNIEERSGDILNKPCLDLISAIGSTWHNPDFATFLNETFREYNMETLVHPNCDNDWNNFK